MRKTTRTITWYVCGGSIPKQLKQPFRVGKTQGWLSSPLGKNNLNLRSKKPPKGGFFNAYFFFLFLKKWCHISTHNKRTAVIPTITKTSPVTLSGEGIRDWKKSDLGILEEINNESFVKKPKNKKDKNKKDKNKRFSPTIISGGYEPDDDETK